MTLVVAATSKKSIWLMTDRRLYYHGRTPKDDARKVLVFRPSSIDGQRSPEFHEYPGLPVSRTCQSKIVGTLVLDSTDGLALLGYAGLARVSYLSSGRFSTHLV